MKSKKDTKMFQVSTLQALALGYSRAVINVWELMYNGDIGLGTFEDVNGEMIVIDGHCLNGYTVVEIIFQDKGSRQNQ